MSCRLLLIISYIKKSYNFKTWHLNVPLRPFMVGNHVLLVQGDGQIYERQITRMGKKRKSSWKVREAA